MHKVVDEQLVNYEMIGKAKRDLLILHGWRGNIDHWMSTAKKLQDRYRVILLDLPGFGSSPKPQVDWGIYDYADFTAKFMQSLKIKKVIALGHSFGGRIGILLGARYPSLIDRLVLVDAAGVELKSTLFKLRNILLSIVKPVLSLIPEDIKNIYRSKDYAQAGEMRGTLAKVVRQSLRKELTNIKIPTLIVWGEKDKELPLAEAKILHQEIQNSILRIVWGASHWPQQEKPQEFLQILEEEGI